MIDTHTHIDMPVYDGDRAEVIRRAQEAGISAFIAVGAHLDASVKTVQVAEEYPCIYASVGVHPHDVKDILPSEMEKTYEELEALAKHPKVVAWGETGLDYYYEHSPRELQKEHFRRQINGARNLGLPLIIHSREASEDTFSVLREEKAHNIGGVFHCFTGDAPMSDQALDMGFFLSFSGVLTFKNATNLAEVARRIPMDRLLVETDCPYLTPNPFRGKRNEPSYVRYVVEKLADLKGMTVGEVSEITSENARRLFRLTP